MFKDLIYKIRIWWEYRNLSITDYINYFKAEDIDVINESCYDVARNTCDGGCQGCSDCLLAKYYREGINKKPTRKQMMISKIESHKFSKAIDEMIAKLTPEDKEEMYKSIHRDLIEQYFVLRIEIQGDDWERSEREIFKGDIEKVKQYQDEYDKENRGEDGQYIPTIERIDYKISKYSDLGIRDVATVNEYLELNPNKEIIDGGESDEH